MSLNRSGVAEIDEFFRCYYIFESSTNNIDVVMHYDNNLFWISADANKDDLE